MKQNLLVTLAAFLFLPLTAGATDGSAGQGFYEMMFGNPQQREQSRASKDGVSVGSETCEGYGGIIGGVNSFFCHMEKDMGITGPGSATKSFGTVKVHAEIIQTATTVNGVTYDYVGNVWMCDSSSADCTLTSNFSRFYYIAFSYDKSAGTNKGYALNVPGMLDGDASGAMEIIYDVGSASATQTIQAKSTFTESSSTYSMRILGTRTSSLFNMNVVGYNSSGSSGFRFAMSGAPPSASGSTNTYNMYYEVTGGSSSNGVYAMDAAGLAAPATGNGFCVSAQEEGTSTNMSADPGACSSYTFGAFDYYAVTGDGTPSAQALSASSILGSWQGMAAHPTAL